MTVSYQYDVASSSTGGFFRLLWRWRGSIWKLLYKELLLFIAIYLAISLTYEFLMPDQLKWYYETVVVICSAFVEIMPLSFILGFYVTFTATRWWQQYTAIPWPDKLMNIIALYVPGTDETSRIIRRTLMRYLNLTLVLVLRSISIPVKRRFPTKDHLIEAGFMTKPELEMYSSVPSHEFNTFWIPCTWFVNLLREAKCECRITDSGGLKLIMEEFNDFRSKCGLLWSYDWVSIPLVYTQVVTLSTHAFFLASLFGRQHINSNSEADKRLLNVHLYGEHYIPTFTLLQFILYMGLLKLGEQLINPFGDDDEDFELNWIIDRHLKVSYLGVDLLNAVPPPLMKDHYFDETDIKLPYTEAAVAHKVKTYRGSVAAFHVPTDKHGLVIPTYEDDDDNQSDDESSTIQSTQHSAVSKSSMWGMFSKRNKQSDSQSIASGSIDSEAMVEYSPLWLGSADSMDTQQTDITTLTKDAHSSSDRSFQGIRGKNEDSRRKEFVINVQPTSTSAEYETSRGAEASQTSPTSSMDVPLFYRELSEYISKTGRKNSSSHTSSVSSIATSSITDKKTRSTQQLGPKASPAKRSQTALNKKSKTPKSMIKGTRTVDPKLKIRPFRSRVTFSDDTKDEAKKFLTADLLPKIYIKRDSSSDISDTNSIYNEQQLTIDMHDLGDKSVLRRQSLDPSIIVLEEPEGEDKWLHYQSLPNIQEGQEDESHGDILAPVSPSLIRKASVRRHTSDRTNERRKCFRRQMSNDESSIGEEMISDEQQNDNNDGRIEDNIENTAKIKASMKPPRQSSTESDTASYHTVSSFLMQISEDNEDVPEKAQTSTSSFDSYKSAIDVSRESLNVKNPNAYIPIEFDSTLPEITITQSTPSIKSSSSDENNFKNGVQTKNSAEGGRHASNSPVINKKLGTNQINNSPEKT